MLTQEAYKSFLQKIVDTHLPDESLIFDAEGDSIVKEIFEQGKINQHAETSERLGAADFSTASVVLGIAPVALGCYKMILEILKLRKELKPVTEDEVKEKWEKELQRRGIEQETAKSIVADFSKEMLSLAK